MMSKEKEMREKIVSIEKNMKLRKTPLSLQKALMKEMKLRYAEMDEGTRDHSDKIYDFMNNIFFTGDYLGYQTASGREEMGTRLRYKVEDTLTKEAVELLSDLAWSGLHFYNLLGRDVDGVIKDMVCKIKEEADDE
tara:strand:+ start:541 stop:948 length:408 start_codon:yes stop_codon:yes gene_type:complete